jgi:type I phosphodiesterase/nucleotide pyrophosphatase
MDSGIRTTCAGSTLGSLAAGAAWSGLYGLDAAGWSWLLAAHAALGLALGAALAFALRRRKGFATGLGAALLLLGVAPAVSSHWVRRPPEVREPRTLARVEQSDAPAARLAIIGLDGADWSVIDPLIAAGELPNLAELLRRGRGAVLRSIEPIQSPVVWTTIFSGRPPHEHGITGWTSAHTANRRTAVLWEMAGAAGLASLVVNVPGTWPPTDVVGALVSGFPMPSPLRNGGDPRLAQSVATLVSERARTGPLATVEARPAADGTSYAETSLGGWLAPHQPRYHSVIDAAIRRGRLPLPQLRIALGRAGGGEPAVWTIAGHRVALARGEWSPWLETRALGGPLHVRVRRLDDGSLFVTPAFQDPRVPTHRYASPPAVQELIAGLGMYVVEPTGWKSVADPIMRNPVFEHLVDVEEMHLRASLALRAWRPDWRVSVHVVTLPDRVSHAFWRFHRPDDYTPLPESELAAHRDKVVRAYRESDRLLGRLIAGLGADTAVIVLSDHGFRSERGEWGEHRLEGMLVAAGPGIAPGRDRLELSVYDVVPLALTLLGLPVAEDLAGDPPSALLAPGASVRRVASYETNAPGAAAPTAIDPTSEAQLRGLGYLE